MDINLLKEELLELLEKEKSFSTLLSKFSFQTEEQAILYLNQNKAKFKELKELKQEINRVKQALMTESEKIEYKKYQEKIREKYSED